MTQDIHDIQIGIAFVQESFQTGHLTRGAGKENDIVLLEQFFDITVQQADIALGILGFAECGKVFGIMDDTVNNLKILAVVKRRTTDIAAHFEDFFRQYGEHTAGGTLTAYLILCHSGIDFGLKGIIEGSIDSRTGGDTLFAVDTLFFVDMRHDKAVLVFLHRNGIHRADIHAGGTAGADIFRYAGHGVGGQIAHFLISDGRGRFFVGYFLIRLDGIFQPVIRNFGFFVDNSPDLFIVDFLR